MSAEAQEAPTPAEWDDAMRAIHHHAGEVWTASLRLREAYTIDTGKPAQVIEWVDLTIEERSAFTLGISQPYSQINRLMDVVMRLHP